MFEGGKKDLYGVLSSEIQGPWKLLDVLEAKSKGSKIQKWGRKIYPQKSKLFKKTELK